MDAVIECKNLTHYYGKRLIYEDLSFDVPKGRILGLLGKNGTGKTTTINLLSGYLKPRSGQCLVFGEDVQAMPPLLRQRIGLLIEGVGHERFASFLLPGPFQKPLVWIPLRILSGRMPYSRSDDPLPRDQHKNTESDPQPDHGRIQLHDPPSVFFPVDASV